jgi:23S rRNA (uracil1939-C5)-methyltransferase
LKIEIPVIRGQKYIVDIVSMGHSCEGVGKYKDFTVFIPFALVGEQVEVVITEVKKSYAKGKMLNILKASPDRVEPKCEIYYQCGGCQIQHLNYEAQLKVKHQQVVDAIERIGKQENVVIHPTLGSENPWNYRNKMQVPVARKDNDVVIGCYAQGSHTVIDTKNCLIQNEANNTIANAVRGVIKRLNIGTYDEKTGRGVLRHVIGRVGGNGEVMVVLVTSTDVLPKQEKIIAELRNNIPGLVSIMQNINMQDTNVIMGKRTLNLWGKLTITDTLGDFTFNISARSFFQVNTKQAEVLYNKAVEYAQLTGKETVIDTYCGTGTITLFLAKKAKKVYGIEIVEAAIKDANKNAENNNVTNTEFLVGDATDVMPELYKIGVRPDVIVVDPPRAGCEKAVLENFAHLKPKRIVYVSCNPASLARDIAILSEFGYVAKEIQPVDMFSETSHIECVALLEKK